MSDRPSGPRLLVVGAAPYSLGAAVAAMAEESVWQFGTIATAGITPHPLLGAVGTVWEDYHLDVTHASQVTETLSAFQPDAVVCTVGVNEPCGIDEPYLGLRMTDAFRINVVSVIELLHHFASSETSGYWQGTKKFVAISSNSARIPRRDSLAYCASKAALSMALRCAARELAGDPVQVWGYEPGLLAGTPMTEAVAEQWSGPLHRMRGVKATGLSPDELAHQIVNDLANYSPAYNGMMIPFDAGEL